MATLGAAAIVPFGERPADDTGSSMAAKKFAARPLVLTSAGASGAGVVPGTAILRFCRVRERSATLENVAALHAGDDGEPFPQEGVELRGLVAACTPRRWRRCGTARGHDG